MVITVGGGTRNDSVFYIKRHLDYLPAIHCIGAAIAFLSGDQVANSSLGRSALSWLARLLFVFSSAVCSEVLVGTAVALRFCRVIREQLPVQQGVHKALVQAEEAATSLSVNL